MRFSPRLHEALVDHVVHADVERLPIAETWRSTRARAAELGLTAPGYHAVRHLVLSERERRAAARELVADAAGDLWAYPGPDVVGLIERSRPLRRPRSRSR